MMEFKRLYVASFGETMWPSETVGASSTSPSIELVKQFVEKYNVTLLLKGPTTIVGARENIGASSTIPDVKIKLVTSGTPGMSTAGSGDVLSGILAGLLGYVKNTYDATCAAVFVNGLAGELAARDEGEISMTASDTVRHIAEAIKIIKGK